MKTQSFEKLFRSSIIALLCSAPVFSARADETVSLNLALSVMTCAYESEESARSAAAIYEKAGRNLNVIKRKEYLCSISLYEPKNTELTLKPVEDAAPPYEMLMAEWKGSETFNNNLETVFGTVQVAKFLYPDFHTYGIGAFLADEKGNESTVSYFTGAIDHNMQGVSLGGKTYVRGNYLYIPSLYVGPAITIGDSQPIPLPRFGN